MEIHSSVSTRSELKISSISGEDFGLAGVLRSLAKDDLYRSIDLAKSFKTDAPRSAAMLAIASEMLRSGAPKNQMRDELVALFCEHL